MRFLLTFLCLYPVFLTTVENLSLAQALANTVENQMEVQIAEIKVEAQVGLAMQAGGPFDPLIQASLTSTSINDLQDPCLGLRTHRKGYINTLKADITKKTRCGTQFSLEARIDQEKDFFICPFKTNIASLSFNIVQPILRNYGCGLDTTKEIAEKIEVQAAYFDALQTISEKIFNTSVQYWETVAAKKAVVINQEALERLQKLSADIDKLIAEDQMARMEKNQPLEKILFRQLAILQTKQLYFSNIQFLKLAMGSVNPTSCKVEDLLLTDDYPKLHLDIYKFQDIFCDLMEYAIHNRYNILASTLREREAAVLVSGAANSTLPEVDVIAGVKTTDFTRRCQANNFLSPIVMSNPQTEWTIGLSISVPFYNVQAEGLLEQRRAEQMEVIYNTQFLMQDTITNLSAALSDHYALALEVDKASERAKVTQKLIEDERKKLPFGFSNLFILLDYEDRLTDALQQHNDIYKSYLQNIARLRFFTGTLLRRDCCFNNIEVVDVTTLPGVD